MIEDDDAMKLWDEAAAPFASFVREGKDYHRDELHDPAAFRLIGEVRGSRVLDLACGEGSNTRILARRGVKVVGVDFTAKMIELARQEVAKENLGIVYFVSDAVDLREFPNDGFDFVACFMGFHDIEQYERAVGEVPRVINGSGRFVFFIPHPCFGDVAKGDETIIGWRSNREMQNAEGEPEHLEVMQY